MFVGKFIEHFRYFRKGHWWKKMKTKERFLSFFAFASFPFPFATFLYFWELPGVISMEVLSENEIADAILVRLLAKVLFEDIHIFFACQENAIAHFPLHEFTSNLVQRLF